MTLFLFLCFSSCLWLFFSSYILRFVKFKFTHLLITLVIPLEISKLLQIYWTLDINLLFYPFYKKKKKKCKDLRKIKFHLMPFSSFPPAFPTFSGYIFLLPREHLLILSFVLFANKNLLSVFLVFLKMTLFFLHLWRLFFSVELQTNSLVSLLLFQAFKTGISK